MGDGDDRSQEAASDFGELLSYTVPGYLAGIVLAVGLDRFGLQRSGIGQWLVRTLAGEGESVFEGVFALRRRLRRASSSMAEAYGWGKLAGMGAPWAIDWGSRALGLNVYGVEGFYIPYFYALSDQIGANVAGFLFLRRTEGTCGRAVRSYARNPVMVTSAFVVLGVPLGLLAARLLGFSPDTQVRAALETVAANLCWLPPTVGLVSERRSRRRAESAGGTASR